MNLCHWHHGPSTWAAEVGRRGTCHRLNALVIGNAAYQAVDALKNPVNDAEDVGSKLESCGFTVIRSIDSDHAAVDRELKRFQRVLKESDVGLFFFAGHGMQIDGENYLAAVDTDGTDEIAAKHSSLALNRVIEVMEKSDCSTSIIILDACRNNPFERVWTRSFESRGLAPVYAPCGTLVAYATSPGAALGRAGYQAPSSWSRCRSKDDRRKSTSTRVFADKWLRDGKTA